MTCRTRRTTTSGSATGMPLVGNGSVPSTDVLRPLVILKPSSEGTWFCLERYCLEATLVATTENGAVCEM